MIEQSHYCHYLVNRTTCGPSPDLIVQQLNLTPGDGTNFCKCGFRGGRTICIPRKCVWVCVFALSVKLNIYDANMIYRLQCVYYKIAQSYVAYAVLYRIKLLYIPDDATKSYVTKSQCV